MHANARGLPIDSLLAGLRLRESDLESDFRERLEQRIRQVYPQSNIQREWSPPETPGKRADLYIDEPAAIVELKLPSSTGFEARAAFVRDVQRLEEWVKLFPGTTGHAVMVSGSSAMWEPGHSTSASAVDQLTTLTWLHEGSELNSESLMEVPIGGSPSRYSDLVGAGLAGRYRVHWRNLQDGLRYLHFRVPPA